MLGGAVSPRGSDNPSLTRQTHSPTGFIRDLGIAYRASGRTTPIMDAFAFHPYEDDSSVAPLLGVAPELDDDRARGLREARRAPRHRVRRHRAGRLDAADRLRRVRRRVADPGGEAGRVHRHRAGDDEAGAGADAGGVLPSGDPARVLPAERAGSLPLPRGGREGAGGLAVRPVLRRRHAEDEPRGGAGSRWTSRGAASSPAARACGSPSTRRSSSTAAALTLELRPRLHVRRAALPDSGEAARDEPAESRSADTRPR